MLAREPCITLHYFLQLLSQPLGDECWLVSHALPFFSFLCWVMSVGLWAMHYFEEIFELWVLVLTFVLCNVCWLVSYALPWHFSNECYLVSNTLPRYNFWATNICYISPPIWEAGLLIQNLTFNSRYLKSVFPHIGSGQILCPLFLKAKFHTRYRIPTYRCLSFHVKRLKDLNPFTIRYIYCNMIKQGG